jgi:hypothetical protein
MILWATMEDVNPRSIILSLPFVLASKTNALLNSPDNSSDSNVFET